MSRLEIAGVMLAVPPLAVSWLEHYREIFEAYECWKGYREEYRKFKTQLQMLELSIGLTLEKLFLPYVESLEELERLKKIPDDGSWSDFEKRLEQRLMPEIYPTYLASLKDLRLALERMQHEVGLDKIQLREKLASVSPEVQTLAPLQPRQPSFFRRMHQGAVYHSERAKFSARTKPRDMAFQKVEQLLETLRKLLAQNDEAAELRASHVRKIKSRSLGGLARFWEHAQRVYELVRHQQPGTQLEVDFFFGDKMPSTRSLPWHRALDMCREIALSGSADGCIGFLADQRSNEQYSVSVKRKTTGHNIASDFVSLKSLLSDNTAKKPDRKQRFRVALTLVASYLQLYRSTWLEHGWNNESILFEKLDDGVQLEQPYLRRTFMPASHANLPVAFDIPFATLGIVLLELCFGMTLDQSPFRDQHLSPGGGRDIVQDREAAWAWADLVVGETGQEYADAVNYCFDRWRVRCKDESSDRRWREQYHQNVVEVLQKVYDSTWSEQEPLV
ncbi:hypothetical protein Q7P37_007940 [Cladosporium fusiforme]